MCAHDCKKFLRQCVLKELRIFSICMSRTFSSQAGERAAGNMRSIHSYCVQKFPFLHLYAQYIYLLVTHSYRLWLRCRRRAQSNFGVLYVRLVGYIFSTKAMKCPTYINFIFVECCLSRFKHTVHCTTLWSLVSCSFCYRAVDSDCKVANEGSLSSSQYEEL